jgi:hypothetical protein
MTDEHKPGPDMLPEQERAPRQGGESLGREPLIQVERDGGRTVLTIDLDGLAAEADSTMAQGFEAMRNNAEYDAQSALLEYIANVHRTLANLGMNDADLARSMGVTRSYVSRILNAPPNLTVVSLAKLARALGGKLRIVLEMGPPRNDPPGGPQ